MTQLEILLIEAIGADAATTELPKVLAYLEKVKAKLNTSKLGGWIENYLINMAIEVVNAALAHAEALPTNTKITTAAKESSASNSLNITN